MKVFSDFDSFARRFSIVNWYDDELRASYAKRDGVVGYGQTGVVYKTRKSWFFQPDNEWECYEVKKEDLYFGGRRIVFDKEGLLRER